MFSNVGGKIKLFSKILCFVLCAIIIIGALILAFTSGGGLALSEIGVWAPVKYIKGYYSYAYISSFQIILYGVGLCIAVYFSTLLTYGLGQLIENTGKKKDE